MKRLQEEWESFPVKPLISVHLNLMEGHCVSDVLEVPDLVDGRGYFKISWGGLLLASYHPLMRNRILEQIKREFICQIERVQSNLPEGCELRLDSHQHTHMIPVVREGMFAAIDERKYPVRFVRVAREPLGPFLSQVALCPSYGIVNLIKNVILNIYAGSMERELNKRKISYDLIWGLIMSGHMDLERIKRIYPAMEAHCIKRGRTLELLFHPGTVLPEEITEEYVKDGFVEFHLAEGRKIERHAVDKLAREVLHS